MATKKTPMPVRIPSARSEDQPASRKMLTLVRNELKAEIRALDQKTEAGFTLLRSDMQSIESGLRSEIQQLRAEMQATNAGNARMEILLEEQNSNNRIVLEGLQALWQRQDRIEARLK